MEINIDELVSNVHAVDDETLLTPQTMRKIVQAVVAAVEEENQHRQRVMSEQRITGGVAHELEEEWNSV